MDLQVVKKERREQIHLYAMLNNPVTLPNLLETCLLKHPMLFISIIKLRKFLIVRIKISNFSDHVQHGKSPEEKKITPTCLTLMLGLIQENYLEVF